MSTTNHWVEFSWSTHRVAVLMNVFHIEKSPQKGQREGPCLFQSYVRKRARLSGFGISRYASRVASADVAKRCVPITGRIGYPARRRRSRIGDPESAAAELPSGTDGFTCRESAEKPDFPDAADRSGRADAADSLVAPMPACNRVANWRWHCRVGFQPGCTIRGSARIVM
ncbi:MAG: hypothetical protein WD875_17520 [Pirellulales bacterium]